MSHGFVHAPAALFLCVCDVHAMNVQRVSMRMLLISNVYATWLWMGAAVCIVSGSDGGGANSENVGLLPHYAPHVAPTEEATQQHIVL